MNIDELLSTISKVANQRGINTPYIVGGAPRDRLIKETRAVEEIKDVDLTTGYKDASRLALEISKVLPESNFRDYDDGHTSVDYMGLRIDFSSHFIAPGIDEELKRIGVTDISDMKRELYSRDFTMNTLLETLDFKNIYDLTEQAVEDIKGKIIKCPINPNISIGVDARRILRAIKFSIKYGFSIEDNLKLAMFKYRKNIQELPTKFVQNKIAEIVRLDDDKGVEYLIEYKILPLVPLPKFVYDILIQKRKILKAI